MVEVVAADAILFGYTAGQVLVAVVATVIIVMGASWLFGRFGK